MPIDGLFTYHLTQELENNLIGGRINKIYQLSKYELLFYIRANKQNLKLFISAHPNYARINLSTKDYYTPEEPPMFSRMLRKQLDGAFIKEIKQYQYDRIIEITLLHTNEIGDLKEKKMIIEIMGRHSNIIICHNDYKVIDAIRHLNSDYRIILPGFTYEYPASSKLLPTNIDVNLDEKNLIQTYQGLSKVVAKEIVTTKNTTFLSYVKPTLFKHEKDDFYFNDLTTIKGERINYETLSEVLDDYFYKRDEFDRIKQKTENLHRFIKNEYEKNVKKLDKLIIELNSAENSEYYKICGDLIYAYQFQIKKGDKTTKVYDYEGNELLITLDERLTSSENGQKYYQKYQKAKNAVIFINQQIELTKVEITYFENLLIMLENATTKDALEIQEELEMNGYIRERNKKTIRKNKKPAFDIYTSPDGVKILVGKNNIQNDYITFKEANRFDMWMHVKDMPGSHVIIKGDDLSEATIRYAANLAAVFSKGRYSSSVPVDYTLVKNIKKVPNTKLGFVTISDQKTIYIDPNEKAI